MAMYVVLYCKKYKEHRKTANVNVTMANFCAKRTITYRLTADRLEAVEWNCFWCGWLGREAFVVLIVYIGCNGCGKVMIRSQKLLRAMRNGVFDLDYQKCAVIFTQK